MECRLRQNQIVRLDASYPFCITSLFKYQRLFLWQNCGLGGRGGAAEDIKRGPEQGGCLSNAYWRTTHSSHFIPPKKKKKLSRLSSHVQISNYGLDSDLRESLFPSHLAYTHVAQTHVVRRLEPLRCCLLAMNHGPRVGLQYFIVKLFRAELFMGTVEDSRGDPLHFLKRRVERSIWRKRRHPLSMPCSYKRRPLGLQLSLIEGCLPLTRRNNQREIESRLKKQLGRALMVFHNFLTYGKLYASPSSRRRPTIRAASAFKLTNQRRQMIK